MILNPSVHPCLPTAYRLVQQISHNIHVNTITSSKIHQSFKRTFQKEKQNIEEDTHKYARLYRGMPTLNFQCLSN